MEAQHCIMAGWLFDGSGAEARKNAYLKINDGVIVETGSITQLSSAERNRAIDFLYGTILPPLVDCSVRLACSGAVHTDGERGFRQQETVETLIERHSGFCHAHGVLAVGDSSEPVAEGEGLDRDSGMKKLLWKRGAMVLESMAGGTHESDGRKGDEFVKIVHCSLDRYSRQQGDSAGGDPVILQRLIEANCEGSHPVVVVANGSQAVNEALDAGCNAVEEGYFLEEESLRRMAEKDIVWIPSLIKAKVALEMSTAAERPMIDKALNNQRRLVGRARDIGVRIAVGTGAGTPGILHGESVAAEIKLLLKAGYPLAEALQCATVVGADLLGFPEIGRLQKGKRANFIVSRGTRQQLPRKLGYLEAVFLDGTPSPFYRKNPVKHVFKS